MSGSQNKYGKLSSTVFLCVLAGIKKASRTLDGTLYMAAAWQSVMV